jgi:hypothetical protein
MELCHALTQLLKIQPLSGMGDLCMAFKISLFLPLLGSIVYSCRGSFHAVNVRRLRFEVLTRL